MRQCYILGKTYYLLECNSKPQRTFFFPPYKKVRRYFDQKMSQPDLSNLSPEQAQAVMQQVRQQGAMQAQQEILVSSSKKCFEKCVSRPGATLSNKEQTCLAMCFDRYLETMQVVSQSMADRSNQ